MESQEPTNEEVHWEPVSNLESNITEDENNPYKYTDESIKLFHKNYVEFWLRQKSKLVR